MQLKAKGCYLQCNSMNNPRRIPNQLQYVYELQFVCKFDLIRSKDIQINHKQRQQGIELQNWPLETVKHHTNRNRIARRFTRRELMNDFIECCNGTQTEFDTCLCILNIYLREERWELLNNFFKTKVILWCAS